MNDLDFNSWVCPLPLRDYPKVILGHGGGGKLSAELVENIFVPAFSNDALSQLSDSASLDISGFAGTGHRLAFSTDSFVVQPLFFRGGNIGSLAVCGTVNDVAMSGATPLFLSAGFIVEEGFEVESLGIIANTMAKKAAEAGVKVVTGDTKVVERGKADGVFINTAGIGIIPDGVNISPSLAADGDVVILSGEIGLHGIAIMSQREGLQFEAAVESDCANLNFLVRDMLAVSSDIHVLRDPTRGGIASALNEIAAASNVGIRIYDDKVPVPSMVRGACEILGLDPFYVANEGKLLAIVKRSDADAILEAMKKNPTGLGAVIIGEVVDEHHGMVVAKTAFGSTRVVDMQLGEQLPRIC